MRPALLDCLMPRRLAPPHTCLALIVAVLMVLGTPAAQAQNRVDQPSPEFEQELTAALAVGSPNEFVEAVRPLTERAEQELTEAAEQAVMARVADAAKGLLLDEARVADASGDSLWELSSWALDALSDEERGAVDALIAARGSSSTMTELGRQLDVRGLLTGDTFDAVEERRADAAARVRQIGSENIRGVELLPVFQHLAPWGRAIGGFQVEWRGMLTAPRDGEYVLSVSPLNISTEFTGAYHHQTAVVSLGGQEVIRATPDNWDYESEPIALQAGQPVPLVMTLDYDYQDVHTRVAAGVLRWKGPGFAAEIVPASAFTLPSGEPGVTMSAAWNCRFPGDGPEGHDIQTSDVVPSIDKCFFDRVVDEDLELTTAVARSQLSRLVSPEFIASLGPSPTSGAPVSQEPHYLFRGAMHPQVRMLESCTSADRKMSLDALLDAPQVIEGAWLPGLIDAYNLLRVGAEREALDLLGVWMQAHADLSPVLAADAGAFTYWNRWDYRRLTIALVWEHPESFAWLKDGYLETDEGGCCLPVAYTVAYGCLVQGQIQQWIDELDARLSDESLTGDARVNWLIARAMAEEIRGCPQERHFTGRERLSAGIKWLDEAAQLAQTNRVRNRIKQERAFRYAALAYWDSAIDAITGHPDTSALLEQISHLQEEQVAELDRQAKEAKAAHLAELERRRQAAADRGDGGGQP